MPARIVTTRPKVATHSANHCAPPVRAFSEKSMSGSEHQVGDNRAHDASGHLDKRIERRVARAHVALEGKDERHRRVEMRPRNGAENRDEHDEDGAGRQGVADELNPDVMAQVDGHDARTDDGRDQ